jgi:membrane associated rhomboid family serine protease
MIPLRDTIPRIGFPSITWMLILLNGIVFIFELSLPDNILEHALYLFGVVPAKYSDPQWGLSHGLPFDYYLSFLTSMFLHGGWLHIVGNMWFLHLFGSRVEDQMGHIRFLVFYLLSGIAANVVNYSVNFHSTVPGLGASGAISGIMGAYIVMFPRARILTLIPIFIFPFFIEISAFFYIGYWFILQLFSGTLSLAHYNAQGGVAYWAHIGGFIAGIVLLPMLRKKERSYRKSHPDEIYHYIRH